MRHSGGPGGGRGGNYEGEGRGGGRVEGQRDSNNSVLMETEGRRGGVMVPKSSDNSTGFASILSCHGRALCATGMTAGISPRASMLLLPHAKHSPPTSSIPFAGPSNFLPVGELTVSSGSCKQTSQTPWSESGDLGPRPDPDHQT